jgi:MFS family permease
MISPARYARLLGAHDVRSLFVTSLVGRLPIGMASLALLLFVQASSGSLARAGTVTGCYVCGLAVMAPLIGRLIDRIGPRPVLLVTAGVYPVAMGVLVAALHAGLPVTLVAAAAVIAGGAFPPVTICVRAMLPRLVSDAGLVPTAYSLDSAIIECMFIAGPAAVAAFAPPQSCSLRPARASAGGCSRAPARCGAGAASPAARGICWAPCTSVRWSSCSRRRFSIRLPSPGSRWR